MVVLIVARELAITGLRLLAASKNVVLAAEGYGKHKTISQIVAIIAILVLHSYGDWGTVGRAVFGFPLLGGAPWIRLVHRSGQMGGGGADLHSGWLYLWRNRAIYSAGPVRLWIAQGFGIGRIPVAPGTFGSLLGVLWFGLLLLTGNLWLFAAGTLAGIALSVWLCGAAEKSWEEGPAVRGAGRNHSHAGLLLGLGGMCSWQTGTLPPFEYFFSARTLAAGRWASSSCSASSTCQALAGAAEPVACPAAGG